MEYKKIYKFETFSISRCRGITLSFKQLLELINIEHDASHSLNVKIINLLKKNKIEAEKKEKKQVSC